MAKNRTKKRKKAGRVILVSLILLLSVTVLAGFLILEPNVRIYAFAELDKNRLTDVNKVLTLADDEGNTISDPIYDNNKIYTHLRDLPRHVPDAFVAIEDKRFYAHKGIDYLRVLSAAKNNLFSGSIQEGASTISQQLIKNTHLKNEKTFRRKLQEMRVARALEREYAKDDILEMYLNIVYFGSNAYGIGTAAKYMFDKSAKELSVAESALLAAVINNPARYSPYEAPDRAKGRRDLVLKRMLDQNLIDEAAYKSAVDQPLKLAAAPKPANQYINQALCEAARILSKRRYQLFDGNYRIETYYDRGLQGFLDGLAAETELNGDFQMIIADNRSGAFLADSGNSHRDLSELRRQPGSAIKPFVSYAPALEKKLVYPVTPILDEKTDFDGYAPGNFNGKYYGWTDVRTSLVHSLNVPAVKLTEMTGVEQSKQIARRFGLSFDKTDTGLPIALGGMTYGVTLPELCDAYRVLPSGGRYSVGGFVKAIYDRAGNCLYKREAAKVRAIDPGNAYLLTDMLQECARIGTARRLKGVGGNVAAKTGTAGSEAGNTDAYCIAYTPGYTVAVWAGSREALLPGEIAGGTLPAKTAEKILRHLNDTAAFEPPETVTRLDIDLNAYLKDRKILLANDSAPPKDRKPALFSDYNLPRQYAKPHTFIDNSTELDNFEQFKIVDSL
ncbi:MAG: transglycosylase domain-containing protein [Clostridiales bacterium]|jgi:membrane peptidoglycan carboxypeptidase|nr:transglycosylase domain-containing protein [Clostridiales bacterium]